jgi:putative flippase GtrA
MKPSRRLLPYTGGETEKALRFLGTGGLNTAVGYGAYLLGLRFGLAPVTALTIATVIGALFNYLTISIIVFRERTVLKLPIFTGVYLATYLFNAGLLRLVTMANVRPWLAQLMVLPLVVCANYVLIRVLVFRSAAR